MAATAEALHNDLERGAADGRTRSRHNQPIPLLRAAHTAWAHSSATTQNGAGPPTAG